jgi:hypothetical protein
MASTKQETDTKNTLRQVVEQERSKTATKYDYNKVLFSWEANDRPTYIFNGTQKAVFTSAVVIFGLYFFWIGQPVLTLVAAAVFFILFVFISIPPQRVVHNIEKIGIRTLDVLYSWDDLKTYWMAEKDGTIMLYIDSRLNFPSRLIFLVESYQEAYRIAMLLSEKIEYRYLRSPQTSMDKLLEGTYIEPTVFFGELEAPRGVRPAKVETTEKE